METSTLVLTALLQLNEEIRDNDAFLGYTDNHKGTGRLLSELWEIYTSSGPQPQSPSELVDAWYLFTLGDDAEFAL